VHPLIRRVLQLLATLALQVALLFGSAGTLGWPAGWTYVGLYVALLVAGGLVLGAGHQELIAERSRGRAGAVGWDRSLTRGLLVGWVAILVTGGLAVRFSWQPQFSRGVQLAGAALLIAGYVPVLWAMRVNRFFSQGVRIQAERGHVTVTDGPYRIVRHPGYAGMLVAYLGTCLLLGSPWAGIPLAVTAALLILRTAREDDLLSRELPGYGDYRRRVRFRLAPGIW
jgi:protein-S-isoprenylcysteine O-methyltransferase Ste14